MKSSKGTSLRGKRKLIEMEVHQQTVAGARRTRSSSNVDNIYTQRSTRSTCGNAFFELPNNYGSRKSQNETCDVSPIKRTRRSSSMLPLPSRTDAEVSSSPKAKKRHVILNSSTNEKENLKVNGQDGIHKEEKSDSLKLLNTDHHEYEKKNNDPIHADKSSPEVLTNGDCKCNNTDINSVHSHTNEHSNSSTSIYVSKAAPDIKLENKVELCLNKSSLTLQLQGSSQILKRKRHFSENETLSPRRNRRMSERGEMASIMDFLFKKKIGFHSLSPGDRKSRQSRRVTRNSISIQEKEQLSKNDKDINEKLDCNVVEVNHKHDTGLSGNKRNSCKATDKNALLHCPQCLLDKGRTAKEKLINHKKQNSEEKELNSKSDHLHSKVCCVLNGIKNDTNNLMDELHAVQDVTNHSLKLGRSLRSSGVKCQPDYYALSLDLMTRRKRKVKADCDLQVMSDSEVDMNRKSSIDCCIENGETDADTKSSEQASCEISKSSVELLDTEDGLEIPDSSTPASGSKPSKDESKSRGKESEQAESSSSKKLVEIPPPDPFQPPALFDEEPPVGPEVYYFESDHVALKHNTDYHALLRTACLLEAQRKQALNDIDVLQQKEKEALASPIQFVDNLQNEVDMNLPKPQVIAELPNIDWTKYTSPFGTFENVFSREVSRSSKPFTRRKKSVHTAVTSTRSQADAKPRSQTFKKSWSVEEQRKLEDLLHKYPPEAVEFNRMRKIASELEGRTPLQVQSRVQKYFIKLAKAGYPIPGRMPRLDRQLAHKPRRHRSHHQSALTRKSTFFSNFHIPVKMNDDDDGDHDDDNDGFEVRSNEGDEEGEGWGPLKSEISDEEDIPEELRYTDEYLEILQLKRRRKQLLCMFDDKGQRAIARHYGYQCDICDAVPIEGVRYHCIDCPEAASVDLCQSCIRLQSNFSTETHKTNHRMEPIYASVAVDDGGTTVDPSTRPPGPYADYDYVASCSGEYNYLDPNFLPPLG